MKPDGTIEVWGESEQRIWEMLEQGRTTKQIGEILGIDYWEAGRLTDRVIAIRGGTPNSLEIRRLLEEMKAIRIA